jgi:hypothetical protein
LIIASTQNDLKNEIENVRMLVRHRVDGLISGDWTHSRDLLFERILGSASSLQKTPGNLKCLILISFCADLAGAEKRTDRALSNANRPGGIHAGFAIIPRKSKKTLTTE